MATTLTTYTLRDRGTDLRVETWVEPEGKKRNRARLLVDGTEVDEGAAEEIGHVDLGAESGHPTRVVWWWTGRVAKCLLVEPGKGDVRRRSVPYAPPPGTRAARLHAWGEKHPNLYAARHVVINVGGTVLAILGVSALLKAIFGGLLPSLDLGWLPDLHPPEWLKYLDPSPLPRSPLRVGASPARQAVRLDPGRGDRLAEVRRRLRGRGLHRRTGGPPAQAGRPGGPRPRTRRENGRPGPARRPAYRHPGGRSHGVRGEGLHRGDHRRDLPGRRCRLGHPVPLLRRQALDHGVAVRRRHGAQRRGHRLAGRGGCAGGDLAPARPPLSRRRGSGRARAGGGDAAAGGQRRGLLRDARRE